MNQTDFTRMLAQKHVEQTIITKPPENWTDEERAEIYEYVEPLKGKPVSQMTQAERRELLTLYLLYTRHFDYRRRAIAYSILIGQIPASLLGKITVKSDCTAGCVSCHYIDFATGMMGPPIPANAETVANIRNLRDMRGGIAPIYSIEYPCEHKESETLNDALNIYIGRMRGFEPGPLFYMTQTKNRVRTALSVQAAQRVMREITEALGMGRGAGQQIQFWRLANDINFI